MGLNCFYQNTLTAVYEQMSCCNDSLKLTIQVMICFIY